VIVNFRESEIAVPVGQGAWQVEVSSDGRGEGGPYDGAVPGSAAVVLADAPA
jgi:hypothetical protein